VGDPQLEILLVEDDPNDVELTLRVLKKNNLTDQVQVVRDGAEALEFLFGSGDPGGRLPRHVPKIILLDLRLPKVNGLEVLRHVKSNPHTQAIPVVVLTSSREDKDIADSYRLGVNSVIVKPLDFVKYAQAVRDLGMYWLLLNQPPAP
jgi:two-component system, response regulator